MKCFNNNFKKTLILSFLILSTILFSSCVIKTKVVKFVAISDIHPDGDYETLQKLVDEIKDVKKIDFILILGDIPLNDQLRGQQKDSTSDVDEIKESLKIISGLKKPIYVIPGNHETRNDYYDGVSGDRVKDLSNTNFVDIKGISFVVLGGYYDDNYLAKGGFLYGDSEIEAINRTVIQKQSQGKEVVMVSHGPMYTNSLEGVDFAPGSGNIGDKRLRDVIIGNNVSFSVCGHVHEAGQKAMNEKGERRRDTMFNKILHVNAAAAVDGKASVITIKYGKMMFETIDVNMK